MESDEMSARKLITAAALLASTLAAVPAAAEAHGRGHHKHHSYERVEYRDRYSEPRRYYRAPESCRRGGTTGLIVGGAAGALLGRELDGGRDRATGTILGAGAGALLGREISRTSRC